MLKTRHSKFYYIFYKSLQIAVTLFFKIIFRVEVVDFHKIPKKGKLILASNHTSYLDPVLICAYFPRPVYFMAKIELFRIKVFSNIVSFFNAFPVARNSLDRSAVSNSIKVLKDGQALGIFPEGTRSVDGIIRDGLKGAGLISVMAKAPILPIAHIGSNKIIQKPHKRIYFPKIKIIAGDLINVDDILKEYERREAAGIMVKKAMDAIRKLYEKIS